ncbi:hypothetical protein EGW08_016168 [Elysia chlorotica]|uniref:Uncharacterized protein n=1 Tax=Elysia chlorotica TaxID=188477 RepID=A0A433T3E9_ELYCH|nr:hypothetical protein EGW08_016168 [Elysia chlorotica]
MTTCQEDEGSCSMESEDESDSAEEGRWLGVGIGLFLLLIFVAWFFRTLSSRQRRLQLISKFHHCCKGKHPENGDIRRPDGTNPVEFSPTRRSIPVRPHTLRAPSKLNGTTPGVIYYTPQSSHPTAYKKTIPRAGTSLPSALDHFGHYHTEDEDAPEHSYLGIHGRHRPRHTRMKKSRSTVSMANCNLAPIQEVEDGADADGVPKSFHLGPLNSSLLGSKSHPDRLAQLALDTSTEQNGVKDSATKSDKHEENGTLASPAQDAKHTNGIVNVNFVHGSDDDASVF